MTRDPYKYFRVEARELLEQLGQGVLELEKGPPAPERLQRLFRFAHTLKGAARVVKQAEIADHAHAVEDALAQLRESAGAPSRERVDALLKLLDAIGAHVSTLEPAPTDGAAAEPRPLEEHFRTLRADVAEMDFLIDGVAEAHVQLAALHRSLSALERLRPLQLLLIDQLRAPRVQRSGGDPGARAIAIAEEIGALLAALQTSASSGTEQVERELRQVREAAERLRLMPVGPVFNVLERTARDAAQSTDRQVAFDGRGGDVRLDAHVLGVVQSALVQIVRNAVAHGIESAEERTRVGKPREGRVSVAVARRGNRVAFVCSDDGRGLDSEAIRRAAQRRGVLPDQAQALGPEELFRLLLRGGISTSGTVTEVAGRGIGLDIVRESVSRLGGEIRIGEAGTGMTIEILVPVSLASLDALVVESGVHTVVIPLDAVRRTLRVNAADIGRAPAGESIVLEGKVVPFAPLSRSLGARSEGAAPRRHWSAVVIESAGALAAVGVDRLLGTANVVLRPLPSLTPADPVVAGASLDAQGNPRIVLDPEALVAHASGGGPVPRAVSPPRRPILVVDDSLTTRMLEQSILESAGYEVDLAVSGEDALQRARQRRYALLLVDIEMPGMDGFELIARLRADPDLRDVPAILVTSRSSAEDRRRGAEVGARGFIAKSDFDQTDLLRRIGQLVE